MKLPPLRPDAMMLSKAAGKKGAFADQFIAGYRGNTSLSEAQALSLFASKVRDYEQKVKRAIHVPLNQNQFDALTSLAYNAPAAFRSDASIVKHLNEGDFGAAADDFLKWNRAKVKRRLVESQGLTNRRKRERALFLRKAT